MDKYFRGIDKNLDWPHYLHSIEWLQSSYGWKQSKSFLDRVNLFLDGSLLKIGLLGFELPLLDISDAPDISLLLQPSGGYNDSLPDSMLDSFFNQLYENGMITSLWLEFDHPFEHRLPLIYFSLAEDFSASELESR